MNKIIQILIGAMKKMKSSIKYAIGRVMELNGILALAHLLFDSNNNWGLEDYILYVSGAILYGFGTAITGLTIKTKVSEELNKKGLVGKLG